MSAEPAIAQGPKYFVNLEGTEKGWGSETISVTEIRTLAGWDTSQPVVEVNLQDNTERTLGESETVTLKPGHGFAKKIKFQRG
jgi:Multiubiquitin